MNLSDLERGVNRRLKEAVIAHRKRLSDAGIPLIGGKKVSPDRHGILRGVYEDNLSMLQKRHPLVLKRKRVRFNRSLNRVLLCAGVCLLAFFVHGQYRNSSSPSELSAKIEQAPRRISTVSAATLIPANAENISELRPLEKVSDIPLRRMLGLGVKSITIDAGHGGSDEGAIGRSGILEKDITLDIAMRLNERLKRSGFDHIHLTRKDDSEVSLQDRVAAARKAKADLFISIHVNWLPKTPINVIETFYFGPSRDQRILDLAAKENKGSEYGLSEFKDILEKLGKTMKLQESKELAESIQLSLFKNISKQDENTRNHGIKRAPFVVLLGPEVPSVLAEVSCLSNEAEERKLNSESHRENIAGYLAAGIISYLKKGVEKNDLTR